MKTNATSAQDRIPINPFWVGRSFLDYCSRQGWMIKECEGKSARYYVTGAGVKALKKHFDIEIKVPEKLPEKD